MKANIGHLEGASGLAGIIKSIMILEKGMIPPNALLEKMNPKIKAKLNNLQVRVAVYIDSGVHDYCVAHKSLRSSLLRARDGQRQAFAESQSTVSALEVLIPSKIRFPLMFSFINTLLVYAMMATITLTRGSE